MIALASSEIVLLIIVVSALALLLSNRIRPDMVGLLVLLTLGLSHILSLDQVLAGFSRPAVITIVGLFVITTALERTGVVQWLADRLARLSGADERRMIALFMGTGALLSLVMNNIAAGAVLLPAAVNVARRAQVRASRLLMPLAFSTLLGGMATLFTTANIVVSGSLQARGHPGLTMLDFLPSGGAMVVMGTLYMLLIGRRLLPYRDSVVRAALPRPDLIETYRLAERLWEVRVRPGSPLIGRQLADCFIGSRLGATVVALWHAGETYIPPSPSYPLAPNDLLLVLGSEERVRQLETQGTTIGLTDRERATALALPLRLTEVVIGPRSPAIGQTLKDLRFRTRMGLMVVALWREGRSYRTDVGNFTLRSGDALLMVGSPDSIRMLAEEPGYIVLDQRPTAAPATDKARAAVLITALVLLLSTTGLVPTATAMLAGAALLILAGCMSMDDAYRAIEWRVVVLIAGMLPLGTALVSTGVAARIGQALTSTLAASGPLGLIVGMYGLTVVLTQLIGGQVTALVVAPIAVSAAIDASVNPTAMAVAVAMGCSVAFLTPIAHPVNVLMMGPGGYTARDFSRVGLGMTVVCFLTLLVVLPLVWRL